MRLILIVLLIGLTSSAAGQEKKAEDFSVSSWQIIVNRYTPELMEAINKEKKKPVHVSIGEECDQDSFDEICEWDWVETLNLYVNNISDFSLISGMSSLKSVRLTRSGLGRNDQRVDLEAFGKIQNLESLDCYAVKVTNTQALAGLKKLKSLSLYMSAVDSIDFLTETPAVERLDLYGSGHTFEDYQAVLTLKKLKHLSIYMNKQATDKKLSVLKGLTTLEKISMSNCKMVTTLDFLENCKDMRRIDANWAVNLQDFSAIEGMSELSEIALWDVPVRDISFLKAKSKLQVVNLRGSKISSIDDLAGADSLALLNLTESEVKDISALKGKDKLSSLQLSGSNVTDISSLAGLESLYQIDLNETAVKDFSPLETCPKLTLVQLPDTATEIQVKALKSRLPKARIQVSPLKK